MGWGQRGEMTQALCAHMNNKTMKKKRLSSIYKQLKEIKHQKDK
jgi:hypothetical protein